MSWAYSRRVGEEPAQNINCESIFFFLFQMSWSLSRWVGCCRRVFFFFEGLTNNTLEYSNDKINLFSTVLLIFSFNLLLKSWCFSTRWWAGPVLDELGEVPAHNINCQSLFLYFPQDLASFQMSWPCCRRAGWGGWSIVFFMFMSPSVI